MNAISIVLILVIILLRVSLCIQNSVENKLTSRFQDKSEDVLVKCVLKTIQNNFVFKPTILITSFPSANKPIQDEIYMKFTKELLTHDFPRIVSQDNVNITSIYMQEEYTLSVKYVGDCKALSSLQKYIKNYIKYLVIVLNYSMKRCDQILQIIGQNLSMYDVTYFVKNSTNDYSILTFVPEINVTTCTLQSDLSPTILSSCSSKESFNAFPLKKLQNYMRCPIKVGMGSLFPFSSIRNKSALFTNKPLEENEIQGSDLETLKIIAEKFNFSLDFYYILRAEENPFVEYNFLSFVLNGSLDLCAGGLYRTYGDVVDYSGVYGRQAIVWMYAAKRDTRSWLGLVRKMNGLYIFMIFYFLYSLIWKLLCIFDKQSVSIGRIMLHTWGALIGTSSLDKGITLKQKILNIVYVIMCMHMSAYVSIQMFSFLTILSPPTIYKTNTDIVQSGLRPYLIMKLKYFMSDSSYEAFANTSGDCYSYPDCGEKSIKLNGVTIMIDGMFTALQANTAVKDEAITLKVNENVLTIYHEMLLRKNLPITKNFQKMMLRLGESGISDRLYDEAIGILTKSKSEIANKNILSHSYSCRMGCSITLAQSAGAFYIWIFGCGLSFCILVFEILGKHK